MSQQHVPIELLNIQYRVNYIDEKNNDQEQEDKKNKVEMIFRSLPLLYIILFLLIDTNDIIFSLT